MMREFSLGRFARARCWRDRFVTPALPAVPALDRWMACGAEWPDKPIHVGVEAAVPLGGMIQFGMLALRFQPDPSRSAVRLAVPTGPPGPRWRDSLVARTDVVHLGLGEWPEVVAEELGERLQGRIRAGTIAVVEAAVGEIGSSSDAMRRVCAATVALLMGGADASDEWICQQLQESLLTRS